MSDGKNIEQRLALLEAVSGSLVLQLQALTRAIEMQAEAIGSLAAAIEQSNTAQEQEQEPTQFLSQRRG